MKKDAIKSIIMPMVIGILVFLATVCFVVSSDLEGDIHHSFLLAGITTVAAAMIFLAINILED